MSDHLIHSLSDRLGACPRLKSSRGRVLCCSPTCHGLRSRGCGGFLRSPPRSTRPQGQACAGLPLRPLTWLGSPPICWILRNVLRDAPVFAALAADGAFVVPVLPYGRACSSMNGVDPFGRHRFECADDGTQRSGFWPIRPCTTFIQRICSVDPLGRHIGCHTQRRCQYQDRMQMVRHDLQLIQPCSGMMFRYCVPAVQHNKASVIQFDPCIRTHAYDLSENVTAPRCADGHEIGAPCVVAVTQARVFVEGGRHGRKIGFPLGQDRDRSTQGVDGTGAHLRCWRVADHRAINFAMIPFAATGIFVPGPYTSKHPASFRNWKWSGGITPPATTRISGRL